MAIYCVAHVPGTLRVLTDIILLTVASDSLTAGQTHQMRVGRTDLHTLPMCVRALGALCLPTLRLAGQPLTSHC